MKPARPWSGFGLALGLCAGGGAWASAPGVHAILLEPSPPASELRELWSGPGPVPARIEAVLEPGEDGPYVLRILGPDGDRARYRASAQFETSMALGDEGPHLDLDDWKHCRSDWRPAERLDDETLRLPEPRASDQTCFPPTTREELREAVRRVVTTPDRDPEWRTRWMTLASRVSRVGDAPSYVTISTVRVRIEAYDGHRWTLLTTLELLVPMGC